MTSKNDYFSYRIRVVVPVKQGMRPSVGNQAGVERYATGENSQQADDGPGRSI